MGPTIILDKSAIQSFSEKELHILSKYYTLNVTYNLYQEIMTDLSLKYKNKNFISPVIHLANKLNPSNYNLNIHYRILIANELLGKKVSYGYRALVNAEENIKKNGKRGAIIMQSEEEKAIERWKIGDFTVEELNKAREMRINISEVNLESLKNSSEYLKANIKVIIDEENLGKYLDELLSYNKNMSPLDKYSILEQIMNMFHIDIKVQNEVKEKWYAFESFDLDKFAPYTMFCYRTLILFHLGMMYNIIGTRKSNIIDLEYLFYLPFCFIFCSGDKLHKKLIKYIKDSKQFFVENTDLKNDLRLLGEYLSNSGDKTRNFVYPPEKSFTKKVWDDFKKVNVNIEDVDIDFITTEKEISIYSPCPCGSGKKFKDCHYNKDKY